MKKNLIFLMLIMIFSSINVDAASICSNDKQSELKKAASNVKITYEEGQAELDPELYYVPAGEDPETFKVYYDYFKIKIINITEDMYIKLENSVNGEVKYIEYKDTNEGTFMINWNDLSKVTTFNYTIYSSTKTECPNEEFRKGILTTPMLNENYKNVICQEIPDFNLCRKYITSNISEKKFRELATEYLKNRKTEESKEKKEEEKKNNIKTILIVTASIVVVGGGLACVIVLKKRRSSVI